MEFGILALIFVASNAVLLPPAASHYDPSTMVGRFCSTAVHSQPGIMEDNLNAAMASVVDQAERKTLWSANVTSSPPEVDVFGQCYGEINGKKCEDCLADAKEAITACAPAVSAAVYFDSCFLRYTGPGGGENASDEERVGPRVECGAPWTGSQAVDDFMRSEFARKVKEATGTVKEEVVRMQGYGVVLDRGGVDNVYMLGQCWNIVGTERCKQCMATAGDRLHDECATAASASGGKAMFEDCYIRYSTDNFFGMDPDRTKEELKKGRIIVAGILSTIVLAMLAVFGVYVSSKKILTNKGGETPLHLHNYRLHFKYETLERATDFFHSSRKLGQGGSGSVFKGILRDGRVVAVKRLFFSTRQWVDDFFNEINLINGIDHKNLVKLLGCSIEGPESLLVYEFVPNRSLDQVIFDRKSSMSGITWQQRFDIILGVAEGLEYLHGGCGVRIIHRDIKASNILLGHNLIPKIADFGLARSVSSDKSHLSTGIAGTLGYMAPEYLVRGQLTEKADLYAFGVLILEIVCGRRNSTFTLGSSSILHKVWKLYKEDKIVESVDLTLKGEFDTREASNVLQIGLLCTQASVALRPSMSEVIEMLCDKNYEIPTPKQPPFLNASLITSEDTITSSSVQVPSEISCSFTANSSTIYESISQSGGRSNSFNAKHQ